MTHRSRPDPNPPQSRSGRCLGNWFDLSSSLTRLSKVLSSLMISDPRVLRRFH
jgi:hypothetical protein